jgi:N-acyl-D-aspartate/D-glutamate deacylase
MLALLFRGGWVVDGLGTPMYRADVGVQDGRISVVGDLRDAEAARIIPCDGLCVSPGWVDISTVAAMAGHASVQTTARYDRRGEAAKRKVATPLHALCFRQAIPW